MDKIDETISNILDRWEKMTPEEFEHHIKECMKTPLAQMLKQFNDETIEALKEIEIEDREINNG